MIGTCPRVHPLLRRAAIGVICTILFDLSPGHGVTYEHVEKASLYGALKLVPLTRVPPPLQPLGYRVPHHAERGGLNMADWWDACKSCKEREMAAVTRGGANENEKHSAALGLKLCRMCMTVIPKCCVASMHWRSLCSFPALSRPHVLPANVVRAE